MCTNSSKKIVRFVHGTIANPCCPRVHGIPSARLRPRIALWCRWVSFNGDAALYSTPVMASSPPSPLLCLLISSAVRLTLRLAHLSAAPPSERALHCTVIPQGIGSCRTAGYHVPYPTAGGRRLLPSFLNTSSATSSTCTALPIVACCDEVFSRRAKQEIVVRGLV